MHFASIITTSLATTILAIPHTAPTPTAILAVQEVVFRYMFENNGSEIHGKAASHFISIDGKTPSPILLARFNSEPIPVKPITQSVISKGYLSPVLDRKSHKEGLRFDISALKWASPDTCLVTASYYHHARASADYRFTVCIRNGNWAVCKEELTMVS